MSNCICIDTMDRDGTAGWLDHRRNIHRLARTGGERAMSKYHKTGKKRVVYGFDYSKGRWWFSLEHLAYKNGKWPVWLMIAASSLTVKYSDLLDGLPDYSNDVEKILKAKFKKYELVHELSLGTYDDWFLGVPRDYDLKHLKHDFCKI